MFHSPPFSESSNIVPKLKLVSTAAVVKWEGCTSVWPIGHEKGERTCQSLNNSTFKATDGRFSCYKKREGLVHRKLHVEGQAANVLSSDHLIDHV